MRQVFVSERIVTPAGTRPGALLVDGETILGICNRSEVPGDATLQDHSAHAILPGLVDSHVHINEPGRTEWEGFRTATRAAAAGGYTLLVDMPLNCLPETTTVPSLEAKRIAAAGQCLVDWAAWGGVVADNQQHIASLAAVGVPGFKCFLLYPGCDGFTMVDRMQLEAALPHVAASGLPLLVHAELAAPIEAATAGLEAHDWRQYATYLASRPEQAELAAIEMLLDLCRRYHFRLHIVHLSAARALSLLAAARDEGLPVTVETCPHYLHFAAEHIPDGATLYKCAPPIRAGDNRELLWQALGSGLIDLVATDHSPCPPAMKRISGGDERAEHDPEAGRFDLAWGGIASLSLALSIMHTGARARGYSIEDVGRWLSAAPARLAGMGSRAGALEAGREASFVVFDTEVAFPVAAEDLHFRHAISPYIGETLAGRVRETWLRGAAVYNNGSFAPDTPGRERRLRNS